MSRPTVCMVVNNLNVGGLEKVVISLINRMDQVAFDCHLICLDGPGKLYEELNIKNNKVLIFHKSHDSIRFGPIKFSPSIIMKMRHYFLENKINIVHAHNTAPLVYAGIAARTCINRPAVVYSEHNQIYSAKEADRFKFRYYLRLADQVIAVSHDLKETLVRDMKVRCPVRVIHNGIDGSRFRVVGTSRVREELGIQKDEYLVGTGVVISKQKGIVHLVDAAKAVVAKDSKIQFVIAGEGPQRKELQEYVAREGLGDRFRFLGYRRDIPDFISALDLYVLPSLWEGLPLALLEALAIGKPIVATSVGGNPEIVTDGVNGYIVPPSDPESLARRILDMRRNPVFAAKARESNIAKFKKHFSLDAMVNSHEELFREVMQDYVPV